MDPAVVERARQILIPIARSRQRITYGQFAAQLADPEITAMNTAPLLSRVCEVEAEAGRPLLGVVAVNSHNRRPDAALYDLVRELRGWDGDDEEVYLKELALTYDYWRPV